MLEMKLANNVLIFVIWKEFMPQNRKFHVVKRQIVLISDAK